MKLATKLSVLIQIANLLNKENVTWSVGASAMLYLRGFVKDFNDIDIMVAEKDIDNVVQLMNTIGIAETYHRTANYKTKYFYEYQVSGVEVDIIAGYTIVSDEKSYYFPLDESAQRDEVLLNETSIWLATTDDWLTYYKLMKRYDKVNIIQNHLSNVHPDELVLVKPSKEYIEQIISYKQEFIDRDESLHGGCGLMEYNSLDYWFHHLKRMADPNDIPEGRVLSSEFLSVRKSDNRVVGVINIRHYLNDDLLFQGGHVGYSIRPSERNKGYAHEQLRLALIECDLIGIDPILITCNKNNEASRRTIQKAGGIKENEVLEEDGNIVERFWVTRND